MQNGPEINQKCQSILLLVWGRHLEEWGDRARPFGGAYGKDEARRNEERRPIFGQSGRS